MSNAIADGISHGKGNFLSPEPCVLIPDSKSNLTFRNARLANFGLGAAR